MLRIDDKTKLKFLVRSNLHKSFESKIPSHSQRLLTMRWRKENSNWKKKKTFSEGHV